MQRLPGDEDGARDVQQALSQGDAVAIDNVRIGQIDRQHAIVVREIRAEHEGLQAIDAHLQVGEVARVAMKQAIWSTGRDADIAMGINHQEAVAMLHCMTRPRRRRRHGDVEGHHLRLVG